MTSFLHSIAGFVVAIAVLVAVHEYGHFIVARLLGVKVLKFSIGFGKALFTWRRNNDPTEYCIGCIPLGGYVKMLDEAEGKVAPAELAQAFNRQSLGVRSAIVVAGPGFNFLFAIAVMWAVFVLGSVDVAPTVGRVVENSVASQAGFRAGDRLVRVDEREVKTWGAQQFYLLHQAMQGNPVEFEVRAPGSDISRSIRVDFSRIDQRALIRSMPTTQLGLLPLPPPAEVFRMVENSPAARAGLRVGERIVAVDGVEVANWTHLAELVGDRPNQSMQWRVAYGDAQRVLTVRSAEVVVNGVRRGRVGLQRPPPQITRLRYGGWEALPAALDYTYRMSAVTLRILWGMLRASVSTENLSGPITIARVAGDMVQSSYTDFLKFLAVISVSLGLFNLLPIPLLDGGHLLYFGLEALKGRPLSRRALAWGGQVGLLVLLSLMCVVVYHDIIRLF